MKMEEVLEEQHDFSIAIIGLSCRFPKSNNSSEFWDNLIASKDCVKFFSSEDLDPSISVELRSHKNYIPASGHVENVDFFDAEFFGFSQQEAQLLDPQFRLFFECAWETIEDAGYYPAAVPNRVGVFCSTGMSLYAGNRMNDYFNTVLNQDEFISNFEGPQVIIANKAEYLPTRISYKFNLKGPSVNIQSACSSSLVAVHVACQSLLSGESDMALAGASAIHFPINCGYLYSEGGMYSSDGKCKTFSDKADGIVGGNGTGVVLLKRYKDAVRDKDQIHAVIRGSAINNDGNLKVSYMAPSIQGQVDVLEQAYKIAGVSPAEVGYIEVHGTGTHLGDPIEFSALSQVFASASTEKYFCGLGSVKTNIGHLDTAAGMAGLIKTILALKHKKIPATLHFEKPNKNIDLNNSPFFINTKTMEWLSSSKARIAGVSALGAGGTNAHIVLEEHVKKTSNATKKSDTYLLALSAKTKTALSNYLNRYKIYFKEHQLDINSLCYTNNLSRSYFSCRVAFVFKHVEELGEKIEEYLQKNKVEHLNTNTRGLVFLCSGQGTQYAGMGKALYEEYGVFRKAVDACTKIIEEEVGIDIREVMWGELSKGINETRNTQPALFVLEYSLYELWKSWGMQATAVMGHSIGEYVAACIAGVVSLRDALRLIVARGELMQSLPGEGGMSAVFASADVVRGYIDKVRGVSIAAINGPENTVISGEKEALKELVKELEGAGYACHGLEVSHAFHSEMMSPMIEGFLEVARGIRYESPKLKYISNVSGKAVKEGEVDAEYWVRHILMPVEFSRGMESLWESGYRDYVEVGPKSTLLGMGRHCVGTEGEGNWIQSMYPGKELSQINESLGKLYERGNEVDWEGYYGEQRYEKVSLPTYPFERERYWVDKIPKKITPMRIYDLRWEQYEPEYLDKNENAKLYVLVGDNRNQLNNLASLMMKNETKFLIVLQGEAYSYDNDKSYSLDLGNQNDWQLLFTELLRVDGAIDFLYYPSFLYVEVNQDLMTYFQKKIYPGFLNLLKVQDHALLEKVERILMLYPYAQYNSMPVANCYFSPLLGMKQSALAEDFPVKIKAIGLLNEEDLNKNDVLTFILNNSGETNVIYGEGRFLQSFLFEKRDSMAVNKYTVNSDGYYLITGGLGALGLFFAEELVKKGAKKIILVSRSLPQENAKDIIASLRSKKVEVVLIQSDVSDVCDLREKLAQQINAGVNVVGVIHAAGVVDDRIINNLDNNSLIKPMISKVNGAINLFEILNVDHLDFFIAFSSIASIIGSPGQLNYAASNAFLDSFCMYMSERGVHSKVINWGPWSSSGMSSETEKHRKSHNASRKLISINDDQGSSVLFDLLASDNPRVIALDFLGDDDKVNSVRLPLDRFVEFFWLKKTFSKPTKKPKNISRDALKEIIVESAKKVLGVNADIPPLTGFQDLGMDSLMGLQFRNILCNELSINLPSILIYKFVNLEELHGHIVKLLSDKNVSAHSDDIDNLSIEEIAKLLSEELS